MGLKPIIKGELFVNVDFDGTITTEQEDNFGEYALRPYAKEAIECLYNTGKVHFGLWTCRSEHQVETAMAFLEKQDMLKYFEHINGDFKALSDIYGKPNRKSSADVYIDDRAMWGEVSWVDIYNKIVDILIEMEE